jgi:hypothetical protein
VTVSEAADAIIKPFEIKLVTADYQAIGKAMVAVILDATNSMPTITVTAPEDSDPTEVC